MIIELSRFNTTTGFTNTDWVNSFQPMTIQPQGSLTFKSGFLDYNTSSAQVIELQEDTDIVIQTGFYISAPITTDGIVFDDFETYRPFDLYIARNTDRSLLTSSRQFTIPAGNYSPDEITEIINFNCINVNANLHGSGSDFNNNASNNFFRSTTLETYTCALEPIPKVIESERNAVLQASDPLQLANFNVNDFVTFIDFGLADSDTTGNTANDYNGYQITAINRETGLITVNPPFERLVDYTMSNAYMYHYVLFPQNAEGGDINTAQQVHFYRQGTDLIPFDGETRWFFDPNDARKTYMMGASQIQLEYNYNNNSLFQWSYLHTPFYFGSPSTEGIDLYMMGYRHNNIYGYRNTVTGIFFTGLEPKSFWQDTLGFNVNQLVVTDNNQQLLSAPLKCGLNITGNLIAYDALFDKTNTPLQFDLDGNKYRNVLTASTQTIPITAVRTQDVTTSSFYIVELRGLSDINMINDNDVFRTICALGSKEYSAQGIISLYPDGTSFFTNNSPFPIVLSSLRVRILDSLTKQPSATLGSRNSIFIELVNPPPEMIPRPIPQPTKKKEKKKK